MNLNESPQPVGPAKSSRRDAASNTTPSRRPISSPDRASARSGATMASRSESQLSAGHGIDGLQKRGNTVVWFGLNWSLRLYNQFNGRLRRQGQGRPVTCHRILCLDTVDQAQAQYNDGLISRLSNYIKESAE